MFSGLLEPGVTGAMDQFPAVDPIPLPAPMWLFRVLHPLTFTLHITAVQVLLGSLVVALVWSTAGRLAGDRVRTGAAAAVLAPLPILMTFVINLGVPPLLFSQVLYGRALYTSSILIGLYWISVIILLMVGYHLIYVAAGRARKGRFPGWFNLVALLVVLKIALIYTHNFTLLVRPQVWGEMYRNSPLGAQLAAAGDPTVLPRWLFFVVGSLVLGGVWISLMARRPSLPADVALTMRRWGARLTAAFAVIQGGVALWAFLRHPAPVREALGESTLYGIVSWAWPITAVLLVGTGVWAARTAAQPSWRPGLACAGTAFINVAALVLLREGIREKTLALRGMDIWERQVATNWTVVGLFLALFLASLVGVAWLIRVAATPRTEAAPGGEA
jgi:hypothetical protein